jgi:hypothetical protein
MTRTDAPSTRISAAEKYRRIAEEFRPTPAQVELVEQFRSAILLDFVYSVQMAKAANVVLDRRAKEAALRNEREAAASMYAV